MVNRNYQEWPHTTRPNYLGENGVGIDLFDETVEGQHHTAVYLRYADGTRVGMRTVCSDDPEHSNRVLKAWSYNKEVRDYREQTVGGLVPCELRVPNGQEDAIAQILENRRAEIERLYLEKAKDDIDRQGYMAVVDISTLSETVTLWVAYTQMGRKNDALSQAVEVVLGPEWSACSLPV